MGLHCFKAVDFLSRIVEPRSQYAAQKGLSFTLSRRVLTLKSQPLNTRLCNKNKKSQHQLYVKRPIPSRLGKKSPSSNNSIEIPSYQGRLGQTIEKKT